MSSRPNPPAGCTEETSYSISDKVYYFRSGKWRRGEIKDEGGSSENSKKYWVKDTSINAQYPTDVLDIRKISS